MLLLLSLLSRIQVKIMLPGMILMIFSLLARISVLILVAALLFNHLG
jgi:hypothetical protein